MILPIPARMHGNLGLDGSLSLLLIRDGHTFTYTWKLNGDATSLAVSFKNHTIEMPDDAPPAMVEALRAAVTGHGVEPGRYKAGRGIFEAAKGCVGVAPGELSTKQRVDLLHLLLWEKKAIADDGTIRPLEEWIKRLPPELHPEIVEGPAG